MIFGRFSYFLTHPTEYIGLWTIDLTLVTVLFSMLTLLVVLKQVALAKEQTKLMRHQDNLMQRQTEIVVRQDEMNREMFARRAKLVMSIEPELPSQIVVVCRNDGNKTAQNFYWHLSIPANVPGSVWNPSGNEMLSNTGIDSHDGTQCRHYNGLIRDPLYPTRTTPLVRIPDHGRIG